MKVTHGTTTKLGFQPYTLTIHIDTTQDEGSLKTVAARMSVIPAHLKNGDWPFMSGATEQSVHDLLAALYEASVAARPEC